MAVTIGRENEIENKKEIQIIGCVPLEIKEEKQPEKKSVKSKKKS